ncbi:hypothetical protein PsYK624_094820 [Phanerochaete sordida]|uniref:Uncharacterized protein n=1 Tax=Phanerochaete sordida TaxID=48140 RepID=A0A9P3GEB0_9APHY|nr:hypothetical protein PsYK624_094820 [Phanerochaete sordida]
MAQSNSSAHAPALPTLKPSVSQALWGHLRQMNVPPALKSVAASTSAMTPITPVDKTGTSMRMLLHDTQATLEKFSGHIEKLAGRVDDAKREVTTAHKVFQHGHEKMLEDNAALLNRCQTEIQRSLGKPAQATALDQMRQKLATLDGKVDALDRRVDALHMLNQTQLKALHAIQDQQVQLLTALAPVLPLLRTIPLHIDAAKADVKQTVRDASDSSVHLISAAYMRQSRRDYTPDSRRKVCNNPRKRRKTDDRPLGSSDDVSESFSGSMSTLSPLSLSPANSTMSNASLQARSPLPLPTSDCRSPILDQPSRDHRSAQRVLTTPSDAADALLTTDGSHFDIPSSGPATCAPPTTPVRRDSLSALDMLAQPGTPPLCPRSASRALVLSSPKTSFSGTVAAAAPAPRAPSVSALPAPSGAQSDLDIVSSDPLDTEAEIRQPSLPEANTRGETDPGLWTASVPTASAMRASVAPVPHDGAVGSAVGSPSRPMSLKDRRARGLLSHHDTWNEGKRFILFQDEDEEDWDS